MNKNKCVVFIINALENGGAERVILNEANYFIKMNYNVIFITLRNYNAYVINDKIQIKSLTEKEKFSKIEKIFGCFKLINKLNKILRDIEDKYDVELITTHLPYTHLITRLSKYSKKALFVLHNPHFQFKYSNSAVFKLCMHLMYDKQKLIAVSDGVKHEIIHDYNIKTKFIERIYNPIDLDDITKNMNKENIDINDEYILFCGRLNKAKNVYRMIDTYKNIENKINYKLVILGVGEEEQNIKDYLLKNDLESKVLMLGWKKNVYPWMKNAKLLVCSSDYESFGMVLAEALACNTRVASVDCKFGPNEILVGKLSKYLSKLDVNDLSEKVLYALEDDYPDNLNFYIQKFNVKGINKEYLNIYNEWR